MRTRTTKAKPQVAEEPTPSSKNAIPEQDPVKLLLLPQDPSQEARICTLIHPRTSKPCRYYWCPSKGLFEFQRIAAPRKACRSWLLAPTEIESIEKPGDSCNEDRPTAVNGEDKAPDQDEESSGASSLGSQLAPQGHTIHAPEMMVATAIDILFILLPTLYAQVSKSEKGLYLSLEDLLDNAIDRSEQLQYIIRSDMARVSAEHRIAAVCDTVDAGDEKMYRLSVDKLVAELLAKARKMVLNGLPASMEAKFIERALELPVVSLKREDTPVVPPDATVPSSTDTPSTSTVESQSSTASVESLMSEASAQTDVTVPDDQISSAFTEEVKDLLRIRTALRFITASYLPESLASSVEIGLAKQFGAIDFKPLDDHLARIAKLRAEALATRSLSDFSRKRGMGDDDEAAEDRAEKRRKKEEEEKKAKAGLSKGIRDLKKVDVKGMKKMSDFFGKKPAGKK
ncbi:MAG: hypothetical protein Q9174_006352 [Haloplaca sp. 1 TL-2023]